MKHSIIASHNNVKIRQLEPGDLELLRVWRNDEENSRYITHINHITPEMQLVWYERYLSDADHCVFAIEETIDLKRFVGSVSLYNFRDRICECGKFLVGDSDVRGKGVGKLGITLAMFAGFSMFNLDAIDAVVHEDNLAALTTDQRAGFQIIGEHPYLENKMEKELLSTRSYFFSVHDFLDEIKISGAVG